MNTTTRITYQNICQLPKYNGFAIPTVILHLLTHQGLISGIMILRSAWGIQVVRVCVHMCVHVCARLPARIGLMNHRYNRYNRYIFY